MSGWHGRHAPRDCPVCGEDLALTRLTCQTCETELSGVFPACEFCALDGDDRELLRVFLASRGNLKELQRHLGVSYPTARARFADLLARLDIEADGDPPDGTSTVDDPDDGSADDPRHLEILEALANGEIDVDEAERRIEAIT